MCWLRPLRCAHRHQQHQALKHSTTHSGAGWGCLADRHPCRHTGPQGHRAEDAPPWPWAQFHSVPSPAVFPFSSAGQCLVASWLHSWPRQSATDPTRARGSWPAHESGPGCHHGRPDGADESARHGRVVMGELSGLPSTSTTCRLLMKQIADHRSLPQLSALGLGNESHETPTTRSRLLGMTARQPLVVLGLASVRPAFSVPSAHTCSVSTRMLLHPVSHLRPPRHLGAGPRRFGQIAMTSGCSVSTLPSSR